MCRNTSTSTEYTTINNRCTSSRYSSYRHLRIPFHSAYFTATIDVTIHCTVTNGNFRSFIFIFFCCEICACASIINTHHGFRTREFVSLTLTAAKDIIRDCTAGDVHLRVSFYIRLLSTAIDTTCNSSGCSFDIQGSLTCNFTKSCKISRGIKDVIIIVDLL